MKQDLLSSLAPRLKELERGSYRRTQTKGGRERGSATRSLLADLLDGLHVPYKENVSLGEGLEADFRVNGTVVFVDRDLTPKERVRLASDKLDVLVIKKEDVRSSRMDHGIRVLGLEERGHEQTIFLDDPSFNFDYAHILPKTKKCSVMHGHTSSVLVEVGGRPVDGMVVDFGDAKQIVREATRELDHKLFINEKYVTDSDSKNVSLRFDTVHGSFEIKAPRSTTVLLGGEATVENLAREVLDRITPRMPDNVTSVGVYVYEGLNKGSHLLAKIHNSGAVGRRRKR